MDYATSTDNFRSKGGHRPAHCQGYGYSLDKWTVVSTHMQMRVPSEWRQRWEEKGWEPGLGAGVMLSLSHYALRSNPKESEKSEVNLDFPDHFGGVFLKLGT